MYAFHDHDNLSLVGSLCLILAKRPRSELLTLFKMWDLGLREEGPRTEGRVAGMEDMGALEGSFSARSGLFP